jgi:hypothetical protein
METLARQRCSDQSTFLSSSLWYASSRACCTRATTWRDACRVSAGARGGCRGGVGQVRFQPLHDDRCRTAAGRETHYTTLEYCELQQRGAAPACIGSTCGGSPHRTHLRTALISGRASFSKRQSTAKENHATGMNNVALLHLAVAAIYTVPKYANWSSRTASYLQAPKSTAHHQQQSCATSSFTYSPPPAGALSPPATAPACSQPSPSPSRSHAATLRPVARSPLPAPPPPPDIPRT